MTCTVPLAESKIRLPLAVLTSLFASRPTLISFTSAPPGTVCCPVCNEVPVISVLPATSKLPPTTTLPVEVTVVNPPVALLLAPIIVPSILPPFISTVDRTDVPVAVKPAKELAPVTPRVPPKVVLPTVWRVPGTLTSLVHSTSFPLAAVCKICLALPSANLLTAISAVGLTSALTILAFPDTRTLPL